MDSEKIIGFLMIVFSLAIMAATVAFSLVLPILDYGTYSQIGYFVTAGIVSFVIVVAMLLITWIGWTLLRTKVAEIDLDEDEDNKEEDIKEES